MSCDCHYQPLGNCYQPTYVFYIICVYTYTYTYSYIYFQVVHSACGEYAFYVPVTFYISRLWVTQHWWYPCRIRIWAACGACGKTNTPPKHPPKAKGETHRRRTRQTLPRRPCSPVGVAPVFTTMLPNFGFLAAALSEIQLDNCRFKHGGQPKLTFSETGDDHSPSVFMSALEPHPFAVRRGFSLKEGAATPLRGFAGSPAFEGAPYAECNTQKKNRYR